MDYKEKVLEILEKATAEEGYIILRFAQNVCRSGTEGENEQAVNPGEKP